VFREALPGPREALAETRASGSSGSGDDGMGAEARVTRSGAVGLKSVPRGARRCARTTNGAGSIEASEALLVRWAALVVRWAALPVRRAALAVRWAALLVRRKAPARPRAALGAFRDALSARRAALALVRSQATGARALLRVTEARRSRPRAAIFSSRGALSAPWADPSCGARRSMLAGRRCSSGATLPP